MTSNVAFSDKLWMYLYELYARPSNFIASIKSYLFPNSMPVRAMLDKRITEDREAFSFEFDNKIVHFHKVATKKGDTFIAGTILYIFFRQDYKQLDVKSKYVLDIGAAVGDTAMYFLLKGAKLVWAYEPEKWMCKLAEKNLALNHLNGARIFAEPASSKTIDLFAGKFKDKPKVLKIDCEGCEYKMLLNAKSISKYNQIILEYHFGYLDLETKLKKLGFEVTHTKPHFGRENMIVGLMYAEQQKINF